MNQTAKAELIWLLQNAHAGELAAYHAYDGHYKSVRDPLEKKEILKIRDEEWVHRDCVLDLLTQLGAAPRASRERLMNAIGLAIGFLCHIGGWLIPMYGAGQLEAGNVMEYVTAARLAHKAGCSQFVPALLHMAEVEWDHELYFRKKVLSHPLKRWIPLWTPPPARESIRA